MNKTVFCKICTLFRFASTLILCMGVLSAFAQRRESVTINLNSVPVEQVMLELERQTKYVFLNKDVDVQQIVSIDLKNKTIPEALDALFAPLGVGFKIESKHIVIFNGDSAPKENRFVEVKGQVTDAMKNPIVGAAVVVKGTTIGTSTGSDGSYSLRISPPFDQAVLMVNYLGYEPVERLLGNRTQADFTLVEQTQDVEAVVVTALGIRRSEKALNYNVQKVDGDNLLVAKDANFVNALNGRVAGVTINASSSGVGGESKVVMRGTRSISQSSNALYVIDGIPMYSITYNGSVDIGSRGRSEAIADINPEDIESISVLTGAAAAALYGSHASNGAILITTKSGKAGGFELTVSSSTQVMTPFMMPEFQTRYGNAAGVVTSWGHKLTSSNHMGYSPKKDFLQTGVVGMESVSFSNGTELNQIYFSASATNSRGIVPNNGYDRYNFSFRNTSSMLKDRLHLDVGAQYIREKDRNMINQGIYSNPLVAAYLYPRGEDWEYAKIYEQYDPGRKIMVQNWEWMSQGGIEWDNPYWSSYRVVRENDRNRYMVNAGLTYDVLDWLKISGRMRIDNLDNEYTSKMHATTNPTLTEGSKNGYYEVEESKERQIYGDAMLSINKSFGENWTLNANVGGSFSDIRSKLLQNRGPIRDDGLPNVFNVFQLDNAQTIRRQEGWREQSQSLFASVEVGFKGAYYLTFTGRNDWPSQLAGPHSVKSSFFYPSVGGSLVLSEIFGMPRQIGYMKVRGSFASVGLPFDRFLANPTYTWNNTTGAWETSKNYPIYDLKPERTNSWEVGLTMRFFRHFNLDISYYNARTFNQTFDSQLSVSSGFTKLYVQTGNVRNRGIELQLGYKNTWGKFSWDSSYTMSANKNKILALMNNYKHPETGAIITLDELKVGGTNNNNAAFVLRPGGTLGDLYSTVDLVRDEDGKIFISRDGEVSRNTGIGYQKLGSVFPKANMAWNNDFAVGNFNFGCMFSARIGGIVYSATQARMDSFGVSKATAVARDRGGVSVDGSLVNPYNWYTVIGADNGIPQYYTYDATNVRLSEARIGYTIPRKKLGNFVQIDISIVAKNLWMIYCKAPFDPESVASSGNYYQGIDYFMMPSLRNVGFNLRLKF